jgi:uncharacterized damage-inducible protein DinB
MNALYTRLFTYNDWANKLVLDTLEKMEPPPQALERMSHLITTQQVWMARITGSRGPVDLFPEYPISELRDMNANSTESWLTFTSRLPKDRHLEMISYRTSDGSPKESMLIDILAHVINHSTHHRGQVVASIRAAGLAPPATDFIFFTRTARM